MPENPYWPMHIAGPNGEPSTHKGFTGVPVTDNARKLGKDVMKFSKKRLRMPRRKKDPKYY